ncbi:helix-turn-helix domain-containing protein [Rossellomorea vietnamensis]|uniref:helix-turn-helix domain-containing protein n=1 Tax=Rossellomorea vietnamensis TaxID=218284 RepID=UPI000AC7B167|nr:helix-turn-helix transcriptional regulator [Rossellomorea vietnamensis]
MDIHNGLNNIIGKQIRTERKLQNLTIDELAELAGLHHTHMGDIERGNVNTTIVTLFNVAAALNLDDPSDLLTKAIKDLYPHFQEEVKKRTIKKR